MKIFDISQEVFSSIVYPGDKIPYKEEQLRMSKGDVYNLSSFTMSSHSGTHIDAPFHFIENGDTIENIPLEKTVGYCYVTTENDKISAEKALEIIKAAQAFNPDAAKRILIKGQGEVTVDAAKVFCNHSLYLIGVEGLSVGSATAPKEIHQMLLSKNIVLLEGLRLSSINDGVYFLSAAPILLKDLDGAPCRAILIKE